MKIIIKLLSSGLGTGYFPVASGTAGTALAAVLYWFVFPHNTFFLPIVLLPVLILSIPVSAQAEKLFGNEDDSHIVIDEIVGFWVSVLFLPFSPAIVISAFVIFRVADIIKPFYICEVQKLPHGWGVVMDDVLAGVLTNIILQIAVRILHIF